MIRRRAVDRRHREDVAGEHVLDDRHTALRPRLLDLLREHLFGVRLDRLVDREHDVVPALGRLQYVLAARDLVALGVTLDPCLARVATQRLLVRRLDAREAVVVRADPAEDGRGEEPRRVEPLRLGEVRETREAELLHARDRCVVDLAGDVREPARAVRQPLRERLLVDDDDRRELGRVAVRVADDVRVGDDRGLRDRERELDAVAVEDAPPLGGQRDRADPLPDAERLEVRLVAGLEVDEPRADADEHERRDRKEDGEPEPDRRDLPRPPRRDGRAPPGPGHGASPRCGFTFFQSPRVVAVSAPTSGGTGAPGTSR